MKKINPLIGMLLILLSYSIVVIILMIIVGILTPGGEQLPMTILAYGINIVPLIGTTSFFILSVIKIEWVRKNWLIAIIVFGIFIYWFYKFPLFWISNLM